MVELNLSTTALAQAIGTRAADLAEIVNGQQPINSQTDTLLCQHFRFSRGYFMRLQHAYDAMAQKVSRETIDR